MKLEIRRSARADVLRSQVTSRNEIKNGLEDLIEDNTQTPDTRVTAEGFRIALESFQTTLLMLIWDEILKKMDKTSEILKRKDVHLLCANKKLQTLYLFLSVKRSNFDDYEAKALQLANVPESNYGKNKKKEFSFTGEKRPIFLENISKREILNCGVFLTKYLQYFRTMKQKKRLIRSYERKFEILRNLHEKE
ncbi:dimer_Tnp_hAT domain-containing protein [Trichonephila clavipes]|uniref:Dimer_Tnp_hAT domain-containing protein n=1 Tax=Trichonephila clavipes TaxID=2585209 RepID=A0A8X6RCK7_TRICX|nr:dimer_Tnp_hAT domain-containing protein [Trichonephila clavipes]